MQHNTHSMRLSVKAFHAQHAHMHAWRCTRPAAAACTPAYVPCNQLHVHATLGKGSCQAAQQPSLFPPTRHRCDTSGAPSAPLLAAPLASRCRRPIWRPCELRRRDCLPQARPTLPCTRYGTAPGQQLPGGYSCKYTSEDLSHRCWMKEGMKGCATLLCCCQLLSMGLKMAEQRRTPPNAAVRVVQVQLSVDAPRVSAQLGRTTRPQKGNGMGGVGTSANTKIRAEGFRLKQRTGQDTQYTERLFRANKDAVFLASLKAPL